MKEYEAKSIEELRFEDYQAKRGGGLTQKPATLIFGQPRCSTCIFGSTATTANKPLFGGTKTAATGSTFGGSTGFGGFGTAAPAATPTTSIFGSVCVFFIDI